MNSNPQRSWLMDLEPDRLHAAGSRPMWLARLGVLGLLAQEPAVPLLLLLPSLLLALLGLRWPAGAAPPLRERQLLLASAFALELTLSVSAALGAWPVAPPLVALVLVVACLHGHLFEAQPSRPWALAVTSVPVAVGAPVALLLGHAGVAALLAAAGVGAVAVALWAGKLAGASAARLRREAALRHAMEAQWLERQAVPSDDPQRLRAFHHDLNNSLQGALLASDGLVGALGREGQAALVSELAAEVASELSRASKMTREFRPLRARPLARAKVSVEAVALSIVERCRERFLAVSVAHTPGAALELELVGGEDMLRRVLEGLLVNACEGDGRRAARSVELKLELTSELLRLAVVDDGPGFPMERLPAPAEPFWTTKPSRNGLGLCTAEMLVRANGGALARANRPEGGAVVTVELPRSARPG